MDDQIKVSDTEPTQTTFDLDAFVAGKTTMPIVGVTIYFDQDGGYQLGQAMDKRDELTSRLSELEATPNPTLAVGEENPVLAQKTALTDKLNALALQITELEARVVSSALYFEFQVKDREDVATATQAANDALTDAEKDDRMAIMGNQIDYTIAATIIRVTNASQQTIEGPLTAAQIKSMRGKLIPSENTKLVNALNTALSAGENWSNRIDAGFPG